jgi:hypothetical protein
LAERSRHIRAGRGSALTSVAANVKDTAGIVNNLMTGTAPCLWREVPAQIRRLVQQRNPTAARDLDGEVRGFARALAAVATRVEL